MSLYFPLFLSCILSAPSLDKLGYFFVSPPMESPTRASDLSVNINSELFSKDSFLFYSRYIDSVCLKALSPGNSLSAAEVKRYQDRLGTNYMYLNFYYQRKEWNTTLALAAYEKGETGLNWNSPVLTGFCYLLLRLV